MLKVFHNIKVLCSSKLNSKRIIPSVIVFVGLICHGFSTKAQKLTDERKIQLGIHSGVGYVGYRTDVNAVYRFSTIMLGASIGILTSDVLTWKTPMSYSLEAGYFLAKQKVTNPYIGLSYHISPFKSRQSNQRHLSSELYFNQGLFIDIKKHVYISTVIGYGFYVERFYNPREQSYERFQGITGQLEVGCGYRF